MLELIDQSIAAHGGMARWNRLQRVALTARFGGVALVQRGQEAFTRQPTRVEVDTRRQRTSFTSFLAEGQRGVFEPTRSLVESLDGARLQTLEQPRASFADWTAGTPWSATQLAYFAGYAMWMYLTVPFSLATHGVACEEAAPLEEGDETWRVVNLLFPESYVTHSREQRIYIDAAGLIRRHDYTVEIAGGGRAAHYLDDHREAGGIVFPTHRRVHLLDAQGRPNRDFVAISADLSEIELTERAE